MSLTSACRTRSMKGTRHDCVLGGGCAAAGAHRHRVDLSASRADPLVAPRRGNLRSGKHARLGRSRGGGVGLMLAVAMLFWFVLVRRQEQARDHERLVVEQHANAAERRRLEEEIRRQDAERKHQEAERINLELKSQLFANIGIMAGSY